MTREVFLTTKSTKVFTKDTPTLRLLRNTGAGSVQHSALYKVRILFIDRLTGFLGKT